MKTSHWARLRTVIDLNPSKSEISAGLDKSDEVSFLPMEAIGEDGSLVTDRTRPLVEVEAGYSYFRNGDVLVAKITPCFENGKGAVVNDLLNGFGFGTTEVIVARPRSGRMGSRYLFWVTQSPDFRRWGEGAMYGAGGQKRVPDNFVKDYRAWVPPLHEQTAIAAFLDRETGKIDALVEEQRRLIELLKEKCQAVISHAVTKGLAPNVRMKPSGVEWLGDVPEHWEVRRLRFLCNIETGDSDTIDADADGDFPFYVRSQTIERIGRFSHDCEAVLTSGDGAGVGKIFHYVRGKFSAHQRVYIFTNFRGVSGPFFYRYLVEHFYKVALEGGAKSTVDSLRRPLIANFLMTVPPPEEQEQIVRIVDRISVRFEALIAASEQAISLIQERRSALISAAVTGKIDLRNYGVEEAT